MGMWTIAYESAVQYTRERGFYPSVICTVHKKDTCDVIGHNARTFKVEATDFHLLKFDAYTICADCEPHR